MFKATLVHTLKAIQKGSLADTVESIAASNLTTKAVSIATSAAKISATRKNKNRLNGLGFRLGFKFIT
jgi:hypothetical protein